MCPWVIWQVLTVEGLNLGVRACGLDALTSLIVMMMASGSEVNTIMNHYDIKQYRDDGAMYIHTGHISCNPIVKSP